MGTRLLLFIEFTRYDTVFNLIEYKCTLFENFKSYIFSKFKKHYIVKKSLDNTKLRKKRLKFIRNFRLYFFKNFTLNRFISSGY